jgi:hypothetical protein
LCGADLFFKLFVSFIGITKASVLVKHNISMAVEKHAVLLSDRGLVQDAVARLLFLLLLDVALVGVESMMCIKNLIPQFIFVVFFLFVFYQ